MFTRISEGINRFIAGRREARRRAKEKAEALGIQREIDRELAQREAEERQRQEDFLYALGNDFEDTVASMFDPSRFRQIHRTPRHDQAGGRYVPGMELPDLRFQEISTGRRFWVECKYRARPNPDWSLDWCSPQQLRSYKEAMRSTKEPVLILIGVGGPVRSPDRIYCLDLERLDNTTIFYGAYKGSRLYMKPYSLDALLYIGGQ